MVTKVLDTIERHCLLEKGEGVVAGVSGGPDSVCLLHVLHVISEKLSLALHAVHINHMLRGEESELDRKAVEALCSSLGVPLYAEEWNVKEYAAQKGISLEEAGREIRYRVFYRIMEKTRSSKIAVAHNRNDQAETVLMNILRGTGLDGLKGMEYRKGPVIRPLLDIPRGEIEAYCRENLLHPRIDSSNLESYYTRNKVRLHLIPHIDALFAANTVENICRMTGLIKDDADFLEQRALEAFQQCLEEAGERSVRLNLARIAGLHRAMQKRVLRLAIKQVKGDLKDIESHHIETVARLCAGGRQGARISLPDRVEAEKSYGRLIISVKNPEKKAAVFENDMILPGITTIEGRGKILATLSERKPGEVVNYVNLGYNSFIQFFDYDKLGKGISIRNRRPGDIFKPYGSRGTKKLKEYFIDNKIPRDARDEILLVAKGREIVWIIGYRPSDKFRVTENTKNVVTMEYTTWKSL